MTVLRDCVEELNIINWNYVCYVEKWIEMLLTYSVVEISLSFILIFFTLRLFVCDPVS